VLLGLASAVDVVRVVAVASSGSEVLGRAEAVADPLLDVEAVVHRIEEVVLRPRMSWKSPAAWRAAS
jgi:hypothetical protein